MKYNEIFSQNVLFYLKEIKKNRNWLARETGLTVFPIYQCLKNDANPTLETMEKISNALKIPLPLLLDTSHFKEKPLVEKNLPSKYIFFMGVLPKFQAFLMRSHKKENTLFQKNPPKTLL